VVSLEQGSRRGAGSFGFVISLLLFSAALYYGVNIGKVYLRYYQLSDDMRTQAEMAPGLQNDVISRRLGEQADSLLPGKRPRFRITRGGHPNRIVIETEYTDQVDLPFFRHTFLLHPRAEEPL
jgi:hypothetical protein